MSDQVNRRGFLRKAWKTGASLMTGAGAWTTWDLLQPRLPAGFGTKIKTVPPEAVPADAVIEIPQARAYLTRVNDEIVALSEVCSHLGCRVPFCEASGQFECPCHGSFFNRAGDHQAGPAPRGMDQYGVEVVDGVVVIDTDQRITGTSPGTQTIPDGLQDPGCAEATGHA